MTRQIVIINTQADRDRAAAWVRAARPGARVEIRNTVRSGSQNARMWALLSIIARECFWYEQFYDAESWKDYFMNKLKGTRWMPDEDGGMVPIGRSTSKLETPEHHALMKLIEEFAARHEIQL